MHIYQQIINDLLHVHSDEGDPWVKYIEQEFAGNKEFMLMAVKQHGGALTHATDELQADHEIVLAAVNQNGGVLRFVTDELQADHEIVLAAVNQDGYALRFATDELREDREIVLAAVNQDGRVLTYATAELKADREIVLAAVNQNGTALMHATAELQADCEIVLATIKQDGYALEYAAAELKEDREIVLAAVKQDGFALAHATDELKADHEIVLAAVNQNGRVLSYATDELKADREIVLAAVNQNGNVLRFATGELKEDREIVLAAINQDGRALRFLSDELKVDHEIAAVTQNAFALEYASDSFLKNSDITDSIVDTLKNDPGNKEIFHNWVDKPEMKDMLKALVKFDRTIAYVTNKKGQRAIDIAHSDCKKAMESALYLFETYDVVDDTPLLHKSATACVFKAFRVGEEEDGEASNDSSDKKERNRIPVAMKCMEDHSQVIAEVEGRKDFDPCAKCIIGLQAVYVDSSVSTDDYKELKAAAKECDYQHLTIHPQLMNLKNQIGGIISEKNIQIRQDDTTMKDKDQQELNQERDRYSYVLVFEYGDRTLDTVLTHSRIKPSSYLAKQLLKDMANACLMLHLNGRIHGDLKPLNIMLVGLRLKLIDLDVSCLIGQPYGQKLPSSGFSPPEMATLLASNKERHNLPSLNASIAHDLFSFGVIMYHIESAQPLWKTDQDGNIANEEKKVFMKWSKQALLDKLDNVSCSKEAEDLLLKVLHPDPQQRLNFFQDKEYDKGCEMRKVLDEPYFSKDAKLQKSVDKMYENVEKIKDEVLIIRGLSEKHTYELTKVMHAIYDATEVTTPTTFVILKEKLPDTALSEDEKNELLKLKWKEDGSGFEFEGENSEKIKAILANMEQAKEWATDLTDATDAITERVPTAFFEMVKKRFSNLVTQDKMYFYLVDELTGKPVKAKGYYPIEIRKPTEFVTKMMPFIQCAMIAMAVYNGTAGICHMFGFLVLPKVPPAIQKNLRESVHILKQSSSVATFKSVHEKVEDNDENAENVRGACLRELERFFEKHDEKKNYAGLRRIASEDGRAIWTAVTDDDEVEALLKERAMLREGENNLTDVNNDLQHEKQLNELRAATEKSLRLQLKSANEEAAAKLKSAIEEASKVTKSHCCSWFYR